MKAKKSYGQHFLNNENIAECIAGSLVLDNSYSTVLEVGPGRGMLTKYLLQNDYKLVVVEADKDMVLYLNKHFPKLKEHIISADFLKLELDKIFGEQAFALIGNFPYNISSQILFKMLEYKTNIPELVGMFQKEVAERIISGPGSKKYGVISVLIQAYYQGAYLFTVDKSNFSPPPRVQSAVIRLHRKENLKLDCDEKLFRQIVKQTFSQRRKMLRNTLKPFFKDHLILEQPFFKQRPEQLAVEEFIQLTKQIQKKQS